MFILGSSALMDQVFRLNPLLTPNSTPCFLKVEKHTQQPFIFISDLFECLRKHLLPEDVIQKTCTK